MKAEASWLNALPLISCNVDSEGVSPGLRFQIALYFTELPKGHGLDVPVTPSENNRTELLSEKSNFCRDAGSGSHALNCPTLIGLTNFKQRVVSPGNYFKL